MRLLRSSTLRARGQRRASTNAEAALWELLRGRRLEGAKFRRHAPLGPLIVDFVCFEARLVVEVDGGYHTTEVAAGNDQARDALLSLAGFEVLRLSNDEALDPSTRAADRIRHRLIAGLRLPLSLLGEGDGG